MPADPPGLCLNDTICTKDGKQCDIQNSTQVMRCSGGLDTSSTYGRCIPRPPTPPAVTPCERCSRCLGVARMLVSSTFNASTATGMQLSVEFYTWCSTRGFALASCRSVQMAIAASMKGNLARRAGALCQRLEECPASVAADAACTLAVAGVWNNTPVVSGPLDMCTVEGVSGGQQVAGLGKSSVGAAECLQKHTTSLHVCCSDRDQNVAACVLAEADILPFRLHNCGYSRRCAQCINLHPGL